MERSKLIVIFGVTLIIGISFWLLAIIIGGDDARHTAFRDALIAQNTVVEISDIAKDKAGDSAAKELAASISSTTTSDVSRLSGHYVSSYDDLPDSGDNEAIESLENSQSGISALYAETALDYLEISLDRLKQIRHSGNGSDMSRDIETAIDNQRFHVNRLESYVE